MFTKSLLLTGAALVGISYATAASATPYAYSSNINTNIAVEGYQNGTAVRLTPAQIISTSASVSNTAQFNGYAPASTQALGAVGSTVDSPEATTGPGPFPAQNSFAPSGGTHGSMSGARSDSIITAGTAGNVGASNVAEGYGNAQASATGNTSAAIDFTITVSTPMQILISATNSVALEASTALNVGENANARIANSFTISDQNNNTVFSFTPTGNVSKDTSNGTALSDPFNANMQLNSLQNTPPDITFSQSGTFEAVSNVLPVGTYDISVDSAAFITTSPALPVPEPASFALLAAGLLGLGVMRRSSRR